MNLTVGLIGNSLGWQSLLEQIGVSWLPISHTINAEEFSMIVVGNDVSDFMLKEVARFLTGNGSVLCSAEVFSKISGEQTHSKNIKYLFERNQSMFSGIGLVDVEQECFILSKSNELICDDGSATAFLGEWNGGFVIALPFDAGNLFLDQRIEKKSFYAPRTRLPFEQVSLVDKNGIRRLVARSIETLHHRKNLPFIHKWYFPENKQSLFSMRIDTDFANEIEIESLYKLSQFYNIPFTWFVDVKSQEKFISQYSGMNRQEIGVHCYEHKIFSEVESAKADIQKAKDILLNSACEVRGFAAPYGTWNVALGKIIEELDFEYSSEFSFDYDNFPSHPLIQGRYSTSLQIPVHPVSLGSLRRQGFSKGEMKDYFLDIIEKKLSRREPLFFYHHPKNGNEDILAEIFKVIQSKEIHPIRLCEYSDWWKRRRNANIQVMLNDSILTLDGKNKDASVWLHITRNDKTESFIPVQERINLDEMQWAPVPEPIPSPDDYHRIRKFNPWMLINKGEDTVFGILKELQ